MSLLDEGFQAEAESSLQGLGVEGHGFCGEAVQTEMAFQPLLTLLQGQVLNVLNSFNSPGVLATSSTLFGGSVFLLGVLEFA